MGYYYVEYLTVNTFRDRRGNVAALEYGKGFLLQRMRIKSGEVFYG